MPCSDVLCALFRHVAAGAGYAHLAAGIVLQIHAHAGVT
jgi:hypothetical protein